MAATSLIISPSPIDMRFLSELVSGTGLFGQVFRSSGGEKVIKRLERQRVDMIFYGADRVSRRRNDWFAPLARRAEREDIPVVVFTGREDEEARISGLESGAADCLYYEVSPKEAEARIRRHLQVRRRLEELRQSREDMARQAMTDPLTGLGNRRFFDAVLETETARNQRHGDCFSLLMLDLDHFKRINDTHGHRAGDRVLQAVAATLREGIRKSDTVCRFGGEEFALIMPGTTAESARHVAERLRRRIASLHRHELPVNMAVTVSIGIRACSQGQPTGVDRLVEEADAALYRAKCRGRNRTEIFRMLEISVPERTVPEGLLAPTAGVA